MHTIRQGVLAWMLLLAVQAVFPQSAVAADAEELAAQGLRLRRERKDQEALPFFVEAVRQRPTPRALAQLGFCEQALGLWVSSEIHLQLALKNPEDPWIRKNEAALRQSLKVVQASLGSVEVWGTPPGARVSIDGHAVATLPIVQALRATEGRHVLMIEALNHLSTSRVLNVRAGDLLREHVELAPAETASAPPTPPKATASPATPAASTALPPDAVPAPSVAENTPSGDAGPAQSGSADTTLPTWRRVLPWSLLAGAVVAGSIGIWQHGAWNEGIEKFEAIPACGLYAPMKGSDPRCQGLANDFTSARTRTFVGYGVAGALAAGAVTFFILNATASPGANGGAVGVGPGPGDTGLSVATTF